MFRYIEEELTLNVRLSTMANLKAEFHEHLTRPRGSYYDEEMNMNIFAGKSPGNE